MPPRTRRMRSAWRAWANIDQWQPFRRGYLAALKDTETLRPVTEDTRRESIERAFRREYGIED